METFSYLCAMKKETKSLVAGYGALDDKVRRLEDAGLEIARFRKSKSLTQDEFGALLGIGKAQVSKIEHRGNLTLATVSRAFHSLGAEAYLVASPIVSEESLPSLVQDLVLCVSEFSTLHDLNQTQAFDYLSRFGGVDFYLTYYEDERNEPLQMTLDHLRQICRNNGGKL